MPAYPAGPRQKILQGLVQFGIIAMLTGGHTVAGAIAQGIVHPVDTCVDVTGPAVARGFTTVGAIRPEKGAELLVGQGKWQPTPLSLPPVIVPNSSKSIVPATCQVEIRGRRSNPAHPPPETQQFRGCFCCDYTPNKPEQRSFPRTLWCCLHGQARCRHSSSANYGLCGLVEGVYRSSGTRIE